jgi:two-component system cell cycle sensor histidine kinase/response regulator CckA
VEDDDAVRRIARIALEEDGFEVLAASSGVEALRMASDHPEWNGALVTDLVMPDMSGPALATALLARRPDLHVLFITGYVGETVADASFDDGRVALLPKPFSPAVLALRLRGLLGGASRANGAGEVAVGGVMPGRDP